MRIRSRTGVHRSVRLRLQRLWHSTWIPSMPRRIAATPTPAPFTRGAGATVAAEGGVWGECAEHALEERGGHGWGGYDQHRQDQAQSALLQRHAVDAFGGRAREPTHPEGRRH